MTDVTYAVMGLLVTTGLLFIALPSIPLRIGRAFVYAGAVVLLARSIGLKIVAPIAEATADMASWITLFLMTGMVIFTAARGLLRTYQTEKSGSSGLTN